MRGMGKARLWHLTLVRDPTRARWELGYTDGVVGRRLWASGAWLCPIDPMTQGQVLDELWWAVLEARGENYRK